MGKVDKALSADNKYPLEQPRVSLDFQKEWLSQLGWNVLASHGSEDEGCGFDGWALEEYFDIGADHVCYDDYMPEEGPDLRGIAGKKVSVADKPPPPPAVGQPVPPELAAALKAQAEKESAENREDEMKARASIEGKGFKLETQNDGSSVTLSVKDASGKEIGNALANLWGEEAEGVLFNVLGDYRNQGLGGSMLKILRGELLASGAKVLKGTFIPPTEEEGKVTQGFYAKRGLETAGSHKPVVWDLTKGIVLADGAKISRETEERLEKAVAEKASPFTKEEIDGWLDRTLGSRGGSSEVKYEERLEALGEGLAELNIIRGICREAAGLGPQERAAAAARITGYFLEAGRFGEGGETLGDFADELGQKDNPAGVVDKYLAQQTERSIKIAEGMHIPITPVNVGLLNRFVETAMNNQDMGTGEIVRQVCMADGGDVADGLQYYLGLAKFVTPNLDAEDRRPVILRPSRKDPNLLELHIAKNSVDTTAQTFGIWAALKRLRGSQGLAALGRDVSAVSPLGNKFGPLLEKLGMGETRGTKIFRNIDSQRLLVGDRSQVSGELASLVTPDELLRTAFMNVGMTPDNFRNYVLYGMLPEGAVIHILHDAFFVEGKGERSKLAKEEKLVGSLEGEEYARQLAEELATRGGTREELVAALAEAAASDHPELRGQVVKMAKMFGGLPEKGEQVKVPILYWDSHAHEIVEGVERVAAGSATHQKLLEEKKQIERGAEERREEYQRVYAAYASLSNTLLGTVPGEIGDIAEWWLEQKYIYNPTGLDSGREEAGNSLWRNFHMNYGEDAFGALNDAQSRLEEAMRMRQLRLTGGDETAAVKKLSAAEAQKEYEERVGYIVETLNGDLRMRVEMCLDRLRGAERMYHNPLDDPEVMVRVLAVKPEQWEAAREAFDRERGQVGKGKTADNGELFRYDPESGRLTRVVEYAEVKAELDRKAALYDSPYRFEGAGKVLEQAGLDPRAVNALLNEAVERMGRGGDVFTKAIVGVMEKTQLDLANGVGNVMLVNSEVRQAFAAAEHERQVVDAMKYPGLARTPEIWAEAQERLAAVQKDVPVAEPVPSKQVEIPTLKEEAAKPQAVAEAAKVEETDAVVEPREMYRVQTMADDPLRLTVGLTESEVHEMLKTRGYHMEGDVLVRNYDELLDDDVTVKKYFDQEEGRIAIARARGPLVSSGFAHGVWGVAERIAGIPGVKTAVGAAEVAVEAGKIVGQKLEERAVAQRVEEARRQEQALVQAAREAATKRLEAATKAAKEAGDFLGGSGVWRLTGEEKDMLRTVLNEAKESGDPGRLEAAAAAIGAAKVRAEAREKAEGVLKQAKKDLRGDINYLPEYLNISFGERDAAREAIKSAKTPEEVTRIRERLGARLEQIKAQEATQKAARAQAEVKEKARLETEKEAARAAKVAKKAVSVPETSRGGKPGQFEYQPGVFGDKLPGPVMTFFGLGGADQEKTKTVIEPPVTPPKATPVGRPRPTARVETAPVKTAAAKETQVAASREQPPQVEEVVAAGAAKAAASAKEAAAVAKEAELLAQAGGYYEAAPAPAAESVPAPEAAAATVVGDAQVGELIGNLSVMLGGGAGRAEIGGGSQPGGGAGTGAAGEGGAREGLGLQGVHDAVFSHVVMSPISVEHLHGFFGSQPGVESVVTGPNSVAYVVNPGASEQHGTPTLWGSVGVAQPSGETALAPVEPPGPTAVEPSSVPAGGGAGAEMAALSPGQFTMVFELPVHAGTAGASAVGGSAPAETAAGWEEPYYGTFG